MSTTLTVTSKGQVTLRKDVLRHLGIGPGQKIEVDLLPDGRAQIKAKRTKEPIRKILGILHGKTDGTRLSLEELKNSIAKAGASAGRGDE